MRETPKRVGKYEIVDVIARGGMAVVYRARQPALNRVAALKRLELEGQDSTVIARFMRECRIGAALEHPNIVTVLDCFQHDGVPYMAMEYLSRGSLRPWVGRLTEQQALGVLEQLLAALAHAQELGIAHRDLKPDNVLLTRRGGIKVADFGIAKAYTDATSQLTAAGMAIGTPAYMAPEQAQGGPVGPGTDLYAVGVMAFELLSGRTPFQERDPVAVMQRHVGYAPPALSDVAPHVDARLSDWVAALLSKREQDRPRDARAAAQALEEIAVSLHGAYWRRAAPIAPSVVADDALPADIAALGLDREAPEPGETVAPSPVPGAVAPRASRFVIAGPDATLEVRGGSDGARLRHAARWSRPAPRARRRPLHLAPGRIETHVDRADEIEAILRALANSRMTNLYGEAAIGKTHVLVEALHARGGRLRRTVYLDGRGQSADDLLHALHEEFFVCRTPMRDPHVARRLRHQEAVVAIEDVVLGGDELRRLVDGAQRCRFVLTSRERVVWDGPAIRVGGMAPEHAPALAEQELRRPLGSDDRAAAEAIATALNGHPLRLRQAFSRAREDRAPLAALTEELSRPPMLHDRLDTLSPLEGRVVRALAVYGGLSVGSEHLRGLVGEPDLDDAVGRLAERRDVAVESGRIRLLGVLAHALPASDDLVSETGRATAHFITWLESQSTDAVAALDDMPAVLALVERAFLDGRPAEAIRLGRAAEGYLSERQRWAAWGTVLAIVLACARDLDDGVTEGWALNQLGVRSLGQGRTSECVRLLEQAEQTCRRAGDDCGATVAAANLRTLQKVPPPLPRVSHSSAGLVGTLVAIVALIGVVVGIIRQGPLEILKESGPDEAATAEVALVDVRLTGDGNGSVHSDTGDASCGRSRCVVRVRPGAELVLHAEPGKGSRFAGWRGAGCGEARRCRVHVTGDIRMAAGFDARRAARGKLAITIAGRGTVAVAGKRCAVSCAFSTPVGTRHTVVATPAAGWRFDGWDGDCDGTGTCRLAVRDGTSVTARFVAAAPASEPDDGRPPDDAAPKTADAGSAHATLTVLTSGASDGTVAVEGREEGCAAGCEFEVGTQVTLRARFDPRATRLAWRGAACDGPVCRLEMRGDRDVTADFSRLSVTLTAGAVGDGSVTVAGRDCRLGCPFPHGTGVVLRAHHDPHATDVRWTGEACTGEECRVELDGDRAVTAHFVARTHTLTVATQGSGSVDRCAGRPTCAISVAHGEVVTLAALPGAGWALRGWSECDATGEPVCSVRLTGDRTVLARFGQPAGLTVTTTGDAGGDVLVDGQSCAVRCRFWRGDRVELAARYHEPSTELRWAGASCRGDRCGLELEGDTTVTAQFRLRRFALTMRADGPGSVWCESGCAETYRYGDSVRLRAAADAYEQDAELSGWTGCTPVGKGDVCELRFTGDGSVTAHFVRHVRLTTAMAGDTDGRTVTADGEDCTDGCRRDVGDGVTLTASGFDAGRTAVAWSEPGCSGASCTVVLDRSRTVTVTFTDRVSLTVGAEGPGSVSRCSPSPCWVDPGETVTVTAEPENGARFVGWRGCDRADGAVCTMSMRRSATVVALFEPIFTIDEGSGEDVTPALESDGAAAVLAS